jgi:chemotaxis signal transduction protein
VTVLDIGPWFDAKGAKDRPYVAVVEGRKGSLGVLVDAAVGIREISRDQVAVKLVSSRSSRNLATATTKDLVTLIDVSRLFEDPEIIVDRRLDTISAQQGVRARPASLSKRSSKR